MKMLAGIMLGILFLVAAWALERYERGAELQEAFRRGDASRP